MAKEEYRYIGKPTLARMPSISLPGEQSLSMTSAFPTCSTASASEVPTPMPSSEHRYSDALRLSGVKAVLTYKDVPDWKGGGVPFHVRGPRQ